MPNRTTAGTPSKRLRKCMPMPQTDARQMSRASARAYEQNLPPEQRKQLGQFFTGLPLGKVLAHLALTDETATVLDPMAGHGDLLDAVWVAATERGISLKCLDGIEIDGPTAEACRIRLKHITTTTPDCACRTITGDAFKPSTVAALSHEFYDLVITNPPYVRYQTRGSNGPMPDRTRQGLTQIASRQQSKESAQVWKALAEGYSGLADLSIPSWLHAASRVRTGGRLALIVPAAWRSRDYADVVRYLLLRCFDVEYIVEDVQPGWFSDALVRTHLIVARRLSPAEIAKPIRRRAELPVALWIQVAPTAADRYSLLGAAFPGDNPEAQFATWAADACRITHAAITARDFAMSDEWNYITANRRGRPWYQALEESTQELPLFASPASHAAALIPESLRDVLPEPFTASGLLTLGDADVHVGQGLRTGCNKFFYVTEHGTRSAGQVEVEASSLFDRHRFLMPATAVQHVLRRQAELAIFTKGQDPKGRVLDLRGWVLPDDAATVSARRHIYAALGEPVPAVMPPALAAFVRKAAATKLKDGESADVIPQLSAVRTNVRGLTDDGARPRFWYMLPDFSSRHRPTAFVPRINHGIAWVECNRDPALLIDANFSTFWSLRSGWTGNVLKALLNSMWCRAQMEALGTPFGGGALKLEATHLQRLLVPSLSDGALQMLDRIGMSLLETATDALTAADEIVFSAVLDSGKSVATVHRLADAMATRARAMSAARQRAA